MTASRSLLAAATLLTITCAGTACGDDGPGDDGPGADGRIVAATVPVVAVAAQPCMRPTRDRGLGVVVGDDLVATAAHTVEGRRRELTVDGRPATVVAIDARTDLALLAAETTGAVSRLVDEPAPAAVVHTDDGPVIVDIVGTVTLVVNDVTTGQRHERRAHAFTPGVADGTSGAPLTTIDGDILGIVVLDRRDDDVAYAVTAAELRDLLAAERGLRPSTACGG